MTGGGEPEKMPPVLASGAGPVVVLPGGRVAWGCFFFPMAPQAVGVVPSTGSPSPAVGAALCEAEDAQEAVSTT